MVPVHTLSHGRNLLTTMFSMKSIALLALVGSFTLSVESKEVNLLCNGKENFYSTNAGGRLLDSSIEVKFNDESNIVTFVSPSRLFGCYGDASKNATTCDCNVSESTLSCKSEITKDKFNSKQSILVNRLTGKLNYSELTSDESIRPYSMTRTGELICESFTKKKF